MSPVDHARAKGMSELRQDRTTGVWVIVAPQRGQRPHVNAPAGRPPKLPRFDPSCPFCPGNEAQLPGIIAETQAAGAPGWSVRVVPNKFPAVRMRQEAKASGDSDHQARVASGAHEVIIESPWHNADLAGMTAAELAIVAGVYRERSRALLAQDGIETATLFHNHGRGAGASLAHTHAQIIALDFVPPRVAAMNDWSKRYYGEHGRCALCDELASELKMRKRIVEENERFAALVPFAAEVPYELWLVPKQHQASFTAIGDDELPAFAALLGRSLARLKAVLNDPPYNFAIDSAPKCEKAAPHLHWRLRIAPETAIWGGFELGAGLPINPSSPEDDAKRLRDAGGGS
jgi:UDPglucose--hexose-1-phosphate uridylyltransferase